MKIYTCLWTIKEAQKACCLHMANRDFQHSFTMSSSKMLETTLTLCCPFQAANTTCSSNSRSTAPGNQPAQQKTYSLPVMMSSHTLCATTSSTAEPARSSEEGNKHLWWVKAGLLHFLQQQWLKPDSKPTGKL